MWTKEKATPKESVKIFYNFTFEGEKSELEKIGMTQKEMDDILIKQKKIIIYGIRKNFQISGMLISENEVIKNIKPDSLLKNISMVFQDVYLLNDTIYNNIKLGNQNTTREEVIEAAKIANCHEFIEKLENKYDTVVSEGGSTLSGGEKQRISIARSILKDAPIICIAKWNKHKSGQYK